MAIVILLSVVGHYCLSAVSSSLQPAQIFSPDGLVQETVSLYSGVSKGGLRVLEHPPQLWHNSQISSSVATVYADNRQLLVARTKNKLTGL